MGKRITKITMVVAITVVLVLGLASVALASSWTDLPDSVLAGYGISNAQVNQISQGYTDGTWKPYQSISRAQFTKMADATFDIALTNPATPTFADVARTNYYYQYIEGARAVGLVNGVTTSTFAPFSTLTREQAIAIIARAVAAEFDVDTADLTEAEIAAALGPFHDAASVSTSLRDEMAFAVLAGITQGTNAGNLAPQAAVARIVGATLLIRAGLAEPVVPVVTALAPTGGSYLGGTSVVITGTSFATASNVMFGTVAAASFTVNSDTEITAVAPAGTSGTTVDVTVTNVVGASAVVAADKYTYGVVPTVTAISPSAGVATNIVNIYGFGFTGATSVSFGTTAVTNFIINSNTHITATAPAGTGVVDVTVSNAVGASAVVAGDKFTYLARPTVTSVSPSASILPGGNTVTVTGTGFDATTQVRFTAQASGTVSTIGVGVARVLSSTSLLVNVPTATFAAGDILDVQVNNSLGLWSLVASADEYVYGVPTVSGCAPASGAAGIAVTITGQGFDSATSVLFGTTSASFIVTSNTTITAVVPAGTVSATPVRVYVTNAAGQSTTSGAYTYTGTAAAAQITSITPSSTLATKAITLTINGSGFTGATSVYVGTTNYGSSGSDAAVINATGTVITVPIAAPAAPGAIVYVITPLGSSTVANLITYTAPVITSITPTSGAVGSWVTINGSHLASADRVTFGGPVVTTNVQHLVGSEDTQLSVQVPATAVTGALSVFDSTIGVGSTSNLSPVEFTVPGAAAVVVIPAAIAGVTIPVTGVAPVTTVTAGTGYTGTVTWSPAVAAGGTFAAATVYTATITLTPKPGYSLTPVIANSFTVTGAAATNAAGSGVVTAVFPATATVISLAAIEGVTAPVTGGTPVTTITATAQYTGTVTWSPAAATFAATTVYTATITLSPVSPFTVAGVAANFFTVAGATGGVFNPVNTGVITAIFPTT